MSLFLLSAEIFYCFCMCVVGRTYRAMETGESLSDALVALNARFVRFMFFFLFLVLFFSYPKQAINENYIALGGLHIDHTRIIYFINLEAVSWFVRKFCYIDRTHSPSHCQVNNDRYITLLGTTVLLYRLVEKNSDRGLNTISCLLPNQTIN